MIQFSQIGLVFSKKVSIQIYSRNPVSFFSRNFVSFLLFMFHCVHYVFFNRSVAIFYFVCSFLWLPEIEVYKGLVAQASELAWSYPTLRLMALSLSFHCQLNSICCIWFIDGYRLPTVKRLWHIFKEVRLLFCLLSVRIRYLSLLNPSFV